MGTSTDGAVSSSLFEDITNELTGKVRKNGVVQQATIGSLLAGPGKDIGLGFLLHLYRKRRKVREQGAVANTSVEASGQAASYARDQGDVSATNSILE